MAKSGNAIVWRDAEGRGFTEGQLMFCREYIIDFNMTAAAGRAGAAEKSAYKTGYNWYKQPQIRARIRELLSERRKEFAVNAERLQQELARIAFADITKFYHEIEDGAGIISMAKIKELPPSLRACIKTIKPGKFGIEIQLHDKIGALDMMARHLGYYEKDNEQKKTDAVAIYLPENNRGDRTAGGAGNVES